MENIRILLDVGGTQLKGSLADTNGNILYEPYSVPAFATADQDTIFNQFASFLMQLKNLRPEANIEGIGMAFPGPFDFEKGISLMQGLNKYEAVFGLSIPEELRKRCPAFAAVPFYFLHDIAAFAQGAVRFGAANTAGRVLCLCLGTGTGSAFLENHRILTKAENGVPENGWVYPLPYGDSIVDDYLSVRGLQRISETVYGSPLNGKQLYELCEKKDPKALLVYEKFGKDLCRAIFPILDEFHPEMVLFGGQISKSFPYFGQDFAAACSRQNISVCLEPETSVRTMQGLYAHITEREQNK